MRFYFFTSGVITAAQMAVFLAELQAAYPGAYYLKNDVSLGEASGDEQGFAVYGRQKDFEKLLPKLLESGKPVFTKWL